VIAGIVVALAVAAGVWGARNMHWQEIEVPVPVQGEARTNPFYAAQRFAQALGAKASWDRAFVQPAANGVLVISGWHWGFSAERRDAIQRWVESGGRLVVDGTVIDDRTFQDWTKLTSRSLGNRRDPPRRDRYPRCRAMTVSVSRRTDDVRVPAIRYVACGFDPLSRLEGGREPEWQVSDAAGPQVLRVAIGAGSVTAINATPFIDRRIFNGDHAALLVAATQLRSGDDVHFLSESEYPPLLALVWQRGSPVVVLLLAFVGVWLWRVAARFGPPLAPEPVGRRSLEEQVSGTGEFVRRFDAGQPLLAATRRALDEAAERRIPGYGRMTPDQRIALLRRWTDIAPELLAGAMQAPGGQAPRILDSIHILETARRQLLGAHRRT
jgi:hypothetical protein